MTNQEEILRLFRTINPKTKRTYSYSEIAHKQKCTSQWVGKVIKRHKNKLNSEDSESSLGSDD
jgi:predicted DNA-binding protein YlxM (UPF0122 family)